MTLTDGTSTHTLITAAYDGARYNSMGLDLPAQMHLYVDSYANVLQRGNAMSST